jgi:hypothetical protein
LYTRKSKEKGKSRVDHRISRKNIKVKVNEEREVKFKKPKEAPR